MVKFAVSIFQKQPARLLYKIVVTLLLFFSLMPIANSEIVIVVNKDNSLDQIDLEEVRHIFKGKRSVFEDGTPLIIGFVKNVPELNDDFAIKTTNFNFAKMRSVWAGRLFAGKLEVPQGFDTEEDLLTWLKKEKGGITFISSQTIENTIDKSNIKVIYELE